jgi:drug/metabolite transporter (DMT)-like permease
MSASVLTLSHTDSLMYLPLADATVITFLAPSIACWACSYILKEPFTKMEQVAAMISLFGVVLIARPTSLFSGHGTSPAASGDGDIIPLANGTAVIISQERFSYDKVTPQQRAMAVGLAMLGVFGAACAFTTIRWIGKRAHPLLTVNYFATWCSIVSTVMMFALPGVGFLLPANFKEWCYLFFLGICGFIMVSNKFPPRLALLITNASKQFLLAAGLQYEKSSRATNMVYTQMFFALGFDKLVFGTTPGLLSIIGSSLILGSAIYVAVQKEQAKSKEAVEVGPTVRNNDEETGGLVAGMDAEDGDIPLAEEHAPVQEIQLRTLRV